MASSPPTLATARALVAAGISVVPIRRDGSKAPALAEWKPYQLRRPAEKELARWFVNGSGIAIINGAVSGNMETFDADAVELYPLWCAEVEQLAPGLLERLPEAQTPSGGAQLYYRCDEAPIPGNLKLAQRPPTSDELAHDPGLKAVVLFETRGEGGYAIIPPTPADCHPQRRPYVMRRGALTEIPTITAAERAILHDVARSFNTYTSPTRIVSGTRTQAGVIDGERPGDAYNRKETWDTLLTRYGWRSMGVRGETGLWQRPGKHGPSISATTNHADSNLFYMFSSNAHPFEHENSYTLFAAYTLLEHNGDYSAAAKALAAQGYGERRSAPQEPRETQTAAPTGAAETGAHASGEAPAKPATLTPSQRIIAQFGAFGYTFRLNRAGNRIEINGEPITDELAAEIRTRFRDEGFRSMGAVQDVYITEAIRNAYHPVQDYLNSLEWDGKPHIGQLATLLPCSDPEIIYPDKSRHSTTAVFLYRWLIGAVAKALDGHQHVMLVLSGPQGCGKSELVRWLGSPLPDYFIESPLIPGDRDNDVRLITRWIWEVSELDATTRKADVSALKAFITKQRVSVRKAYGHFDTTAPALASFIGTINPDSGFLTDPTGNRRFWILNLTGLDWSYTKMSIDQIWAEAVAAYRRGVPHTLLPSEAVVRDDINREHDIESLLESWIQKHFWITHEPEHRMTAADIVDHLRSKEIRLNGSERGIAMDLSRVMAHLQVSKERTTRWRGYVGIMPVPEA